MVRPSPLFTRKKRKGFDPGPQTISFPAGQAAPDKIHVKIDHKDAK